MSSILISQDWLSTRVVFYQRKHLFCRPSCRLRQRRATSSSPPPPPSTHPAPPRPFQPVCYQRLGPSVPQSCRCLQLLFSRLEPMQLSGQRIFAADQKLRRTPRHPPSGRSWLLSVDLRMLSILNECSLRILGNGHWTFQSAGSIFETGTLSFMSAPFLALLSTKFKSETGRNCAIEASI